MSLESVLPQASAEPTTNVTGVELPAEATSELPAEGTEVTSELPKLEEKPIEDLKFAQKLAIIARKDKELRNRELKVKEQLAQLNDPSYLEFQEAKKENNPTKLLASIGFTYEEAANFMLNDSKPTTEKVVSTLQQKIDALEAKLAAEEASKKEQEDGRIIERAKQNVRSHIENAGDTYELIRAYNAYEAVWDVIQEYYHETGGQILDVGKACDAVEKHYEDHGRQILSLKKFAPKPAASEAIAKTDLKTIESPRTLTNRLNSQQSPSEASEEVLSDEESKARAAEFLRKALAEKKASFQKVTQSL